MMAIQSQNFLYLRFALGNPIHPWVCQAYVYYRFVLSSSFCIILSIDAVFHYVFIKFKSNFPLIKEELVTRICIRYKVLTTPQTKFESYPTKRDPIENDWVESSFRSEKRYVFDILSKHEVPNFCAGAASHI